jgi:hypothetical protein
MVLAPGLASTMALLSGSSSFISIVLAPVTGNREQESPGSVEVLRLDLLASLFPTVTCYHLYCWQGVIKAS